MGSRVRPPLAAFFLLAALLALLPSYSEAAQPSNAPLYLALGDSLAFGVGADSPQDGGYVALTAQSLLSSDRFAASGLDLVNLSSPGARTDDLLTANGQLERAVAEIKSRSQDAVTGNEVAVISVTIGANDLLSLVEPNGACAANAGSETCRTALTQTLTTVQNNLTAVLRALRDAAPDVGIFVTNLYNPYSGSGDRFEIAASVGVQQLNGVIGVATAIPELRATLVPIFDLFQGRAKQWIAKDGIHPNNDGYRVIAEALLAAIEGRPVSLPEDLRAVPTEAPLLAGGQDKGIDPVVFWITLPAVFLAGAALSTAYFVMRGRA